VREFKTEAGKVRPESRMIGHTAYVTIARKVASKEVSAYIVERRGGSFSL